MLLPVLVVSPLCVRDFYERHAISFVMESSVSEEGEYMSHVCLHVRTKRGAHPSQRREWSHAI